MVMVMVMTTDDDDDEEEEEDDDDLLHLASGGASCETECSLGWLDLANFRLATHESGNSSPIQMEVGPNVR